MDGSNPGLPRATSRTDTSSFTETTTAGPCTPWPNSPAPLPCSRNVFGVWYSDYTPYSSSTIENAVYPEFVANHVPLNTLSLDTDWKAPNDWNGWEWNRSLFPFPSSFVAWAGSHGIDVTLNIHSSIEDNDPKLPQAETRRRTRACFVQLYQRELQGMGLELHPSGRVQLRCPTELSTAGDLVLVARLVLRQLGCLLAWSDA